MTNCMLKVTLPYSQTLKSSLEMALTILFLYQLHGLSARTLVGPPCIQHLDHLFHHYHKRTESILFHNPPLPLKVYKTSEKNDDGGRFLEIKHADPAQVVKGRTGDRTSFRAGSLGRHDHTISVHAPKCVPLPSVAMFGKCETTRCGELATMHFHTSKIYRHFLYSKKRTPGLNYALYARDNDEKGRRPLRYIILSTIFHLDNNSNSSLRRLAFTLTANSDVIVDLHCSQRLNSSKCFLI
jgi:hypothetical protein